MRKRWMKLLAQGVVIAAAVGLGPASLAAEAAAPVYLVDDDGAQCPTAAYTDLQTAIDAAITNQVKTVAVCGGIYQPVQVWNANSLTIKAFSPDFRPEIDAPAANSWDYIVQVVNSNNVTLDGLLITRTLAGDAAGGIMYGIKYYASSGTIQNNIIRDMADPTIGSEHGEAILISHQNPDPPAVAKVTVRNNLLDRFSTQGIEVLGRVSMTISGNVLNGRGGSAGAQPFYGIEVGGSAADGIPKGKIAQNNINDTTNAIYLFDVGGLSISGNVITNSSWSGVTISSRCWDTPAISSAHASKNKISGNTILRTEQYAVYLVAEESDPNSHCPPHVDQTLISKNTFTSTHLTQGFAVLMSVYQYGTAYTAGISKTQIIGNKAWGYLAISGESAGVSGTVLKSNTVVRP